MRVEQMAKSMDNILKKKQCAHDKRDESDETGVFVEVNEDKII